MDEYQVQVKNVGSGLLFIVLKENKRVYEHLVTLDVLIQSGEKEND